MKELDELMTTYIDSCSNSCTRGISCWPRSGSADPSAFAFSFGCLRSFVAHLAVTLILWCAQNKVSDNRVCHVHSIVILYERTVFGDRLIGNSIGILGIPMPKYSFCQRPARSLSGNGTVRTNQLARTFDANCLSCISEPVGTTTLGFD